MPEPTPPPGKAAMPRFGSTFDPWNSVALGHQRAETKGPEGWRESRTRKLRDQLFAGNSGGARITDHVGAGTEDFDGGKKILIPKAVRSRARHSVADMLRQPGTLVRVESTPLPSVITPILQSSDAGIAVEEKATGRIFDGLVIYVNGSTHPLISDHKLRHILTENGARLSIYLERRQVTHVIVGRPTSATAKSEVRVGRGLSGSKLDKEVRRLGGCAIHFVGVEWVLESIKANRRLPEARFSNLKLASKSQPNISQMLSTRGKGLE